MMVPKGTKKKRRSTSGATPDRGQLLRQRLSLIKKRHEELIVKPRHGLMTGYLGEEGFDDGEDAEEEMQVLEGYGFST